MKFIIGKKIEMTQVWKGEEAVAVTKIQAGPCTVVQVKDGGRDGYDAIQLGFGEKKADKIKKPQTGHLKGLGNLRHLKEFRVENTGVERGDVIDASTFEPGDAIQITGTSKGKGFQGVVKRHGFKGSKKTHGNKDQLRMPGAIGATGPQHVFKGVRMGGRMGNERVTTKNLEIVEIDKANNILLIAGAVPGARNSIVMIQGEGELKKAAKIERPAAEVEPEKTEAATETEAAAEVKKDEAAKIDEKNNENKDKSETAVKAEAPKPASEPKPETPEQVEKEVVEAKEKLEAKK